MPATSAGGPAGVPFLDVPTGQPPVRRDCPVRKGMGGARDTRRQPCPSPSGIGIGSAYPACMADVRVPLVLAAIGLAVNAIPVYRELPLSESVPDGIVGAAAVTLALLTWRASRALSVQALLVATTWWAGTSWPIALYWHRGALIHLILSAPRAWPRSRTGAVAIGIGYLAATITPIWQVSALAIGLCVGLTLAAAMEARARRNRWIVIAALLFCLAIAGGAVAPLVDAENGPLVALVGYDLLVLIVLCVAALSARRPTRFDLTDLAVDLGRTPVRSVGSITELVQADPGLAIDRDIQVALAVAERLEEGNEQVRDQLRSALLQVEQSRRRLVVASTAERARLAEELLRSAAGPLRTLADDAPVGGGARPRLERAVEALDAALGGLRPPGLSDGLAHALREHPLVTSLRVQLNTAGDRCDEVVEDTLYAVAAEALANVAKHAGPCEVVVGFSAGAAMATLTVSDNGRGGATSGVGSGLTCLADRVEALGGSLAVSSSPDTGTTVTASVPRALTAIGHRLPSVPDMPVERRSVAPPSTP